jgi:poly(glycerol-phosphate) alpha-glucosyltransferase
MKVGMVSASISRQAGGFFSSVRFLSAAMSRAGCDVSVFGVDDEFAAKDAADWTNVELRVHSRRGPASFGYAPALAASVGAADLDILHAHGLWKYPSIIARRWSAGSGRPLVVSPRGMLDPWALTNSRWKKRLAWRLFEYRNLAGAACLHALNAAEYQAIRACGLTNPVAVIPNGADLPAEAERAEPPPWATGLPPNARTLLFLGRLHPKKNLANLLSAWAAVTPRERSHLAGWHLVIAGWDQGGHLAELNQLAAALGVGTTVHFVGPQFGVEKVRTFSFADAFVLPSHSEGLPIAVLEAWAHRLPVLMTAECNLPEGFTAGAAIRIEGDSRQMAEGLAAFFRLGDADRRAIGENGRALVEERFAWPAIAAEMGAVYSWVLGRREPPPSVHFA